MLEIGTKAEEFTLYDTDKKERKLSEFLTKGKRTILAFYPGAFTGVCDKEMCTFRDMFTDLQRLNANLVGISVDAPWAQKTFAEKYSLNFPLLCDFNLEVTRKFGVMWEGLGGVKGYESANRAVFVLDDQGRVLFTWAAPNPGVLPDFEAIKKSLA
ncbi:MAG: peroxiredoxin [Thaumarchaeota archaeon]|nr:peroxiredoxin [Nitrososphaerota archaeon]